VSDDAFDMEMATAALLGDNKDVRVLLKLLVKQLSGTLGERLTVERQGGLLRKSEEIKSLRISVGDQDFEAQVSGADVETTVGHSSGGIRIRSERVGMDDWLHRLLAALQAEASHSQAARLALENIVIGGPA
jgi:hypothetical protein